MFAGRLDPGSLNRAAGRYTARFVAEDGRVTYGEAGVAGCEQQAQPILGVTSFSVSATIEPVCTLTAGRLDFGSIVSLATPVDAVTTLMLRCTRGTAYEIALEGGNGGGKDPARRLLVSGPNALAYAIFTDPGRRSPWGGTRNADTVRGTGTGSTEQVFVYGRIYAQFVSAASQYSDSLLVSIRY
jgi:spore coat protein U-like protein